MPITDKLSVQIIKNKMATTPELLPHPFPLQFHYGWYELYEINELSTVGKMLDLIRHSQLGKVRLDKYMRYDALIGTPQIEAEQVFGLLPGKD